MTVSWVGAVFADVEATTGLRAIEFDLPESTGEWLFYTVAVCLLMFSVVTVYRRDTVEMSIVTRVWLCSLRIAALVALLVVAINPHERTQKVAFRPSRVILVADTSASMRHAASDPGESGAVGIARNVAVEQLLAGDGADAPGLIRELQDRHAVRVYTFDRGLVGPHQDYPYLGPRGAAGQPAKSPSEDGATAPTVDWATVLQPSGLQTRLGESLRELIGTESGRTLSGIVVLTDGASNAGLSPASAHDAAIARQTRLIAVGVGGTEQPVNLQVAKVVAPTEVRKEDQFELTALIRGQGLGRRNVLVDLLVKESGQSDDEAILVETQPREITLPEEDGEPIEVRYQLEQADAGTVTYIVRARTASQTSTDAYPDDNALSHSLTAFDRPTRVLLMAGGPMRDYRFVRNMLFRHPSITVDVWLQTVLDGRAVSQESDQLLFEFPPSAAELHTYDVIIAFDVNWRAVPTERLQLLNSWVSQEAGGLIVVAGDVFTPGIATAAEELQPVVDLYPVIPASVLFDLQIEDEFTQPRKFEWARESRGLGFLQLTDDPSTSQEMWTEFAGFYRCFPTQDVKAGATVLARFPDPRMQTEFGYPVLLAEQFYGEGRVLYLGSAESWRLRAIDEDYFDRFWIKATREVGQGRMKRGAQRGLILVEKNEYLLGETVSLRARVKNREMEPLDANAVELEVTPAAGTPVVTLDRDRSRPGEFAGSFRVEKPGEYRLTLRIPETNEEVQETLLVRQPRLEDDNLQQDVQQLKELVRDTGGQYLSWQQGSEIADLLPVRSEEITVDERLRTLWDRRWVMYVLVSLFSLEWLTRKLVKLA